MNRLSALVVCLGLLMINPVQVTAWPPQPPTATAKAHVLALPSLVNPQRAAPLTDRVTDNTSLPPMQDIVAIAAGGYHTCALTTAGGVRCWGNNEAGQLGDGSNIWHSAPVNVVGLSSGVIAIAAGGIHTCALTAAGGVKCWGANWSGQLGDGTTTNRNMPVDVIGLESGVVAIAAGGSHTCALTTNGGVKCWGSNFSGQLGNETTIDQHTPVNVVGLGSGITTITAGSSHTCALTTTGGVKCWGDNQNGQLGDGTMTQRSTPVDVVGLGSGVAAISTGWALEGSHTCALTASGEVKCWGWNRYGQLGDGTTVDHSTPGPVFGLGNEVEAIAAGGSHTCAIVNGRGIKCWGANFSGQIGDGTMYNRSIPVDVVGIPTGQAITVGGFHTCALVPGSRAGLNTSSGVKCWGDNQYGQLGEGTITRRNMPADVPGLANEAVVSAGGFHTCVLTANGGVKCWGDNGNGQLGDGTTIQRSTPVDVSGLENGVKAITLGGYHTCALTMGGGVKCWGTNWYGQLGDGTTIHRSVPTDVFGLESGITTISAGNSHTCALTGNGGVKCWGNNQYGQLGDGTTTGRNTPVEVIGLSNGVTAIAAAGDHTCALTTTGGVKCWGRNRYGQLGDGTTTNRSGPIDVVGLSSGVMAITARSHHTCALTTDGGIKCWGHNRYGQLGDGTTTHRSIPIEVFGLGNGVASIAGGWGHTCALIANGGFKCWGQNAYGQLGDGSWVDRVAPISGAGIGSGLAAITAGYYHTCALTTSGSVKCWGWDGSGQLGLGTPTYRTTPVDVVKLLGVYLPLVLGGA